MLEIGDRLGVGRTAEVYRLGADRVVKLLLPGFPEADGLREAEIGELVNRAAGAAPRFFGTTRIDGRLGLVYELVGGPTMLDRLLARPWSLRSLADELAEVHSAMHGGDGSGLPAHRGYVRHIIGQGARLAGADAVAAAQARIEALPDGNAVCHGDMHPGNVIEAASGPVVIDWMTARAGPPEADVARTLHLLVGSAIPPTIPRPQRWLISTMRRAFANRYLRTYRRRRALDLALVRGWRLPTLVARLGERIDAEQPTLVAAIARELATY